MNDLGGNEIVMSITTSSVMPCTIMIWKEYLYFPGVLVPISPI